eukprot:4064302-Pyramimonas_sp.AAC.1
MAVGGRNVGAMIARWNSPDDARACSRALPWQPNAALELRARQIGPRKVHAAADPYDQISWYDVGRRPKRHRTVGPARPGAVGSASLRKEGFGGRSQAM